MRTYDVARTYEGAYMAGVVAENDQDQYARVWSARFRFRKSSATSTASRSVRRASTRIKTKVVWVSEWFNPPKETEAATALINGGADVLMQNTDSSAVLQTAEKMGKRAFGWDSDMTTYGPKAHLGSAVINWGPYYIKAVRDVLDSKWGNRPELVGREGRRD